MANPFGLTDQQKRFADGVLAGKTQRDAYVDAGYKARGKSADEAASRLARNVKVASYLDARREKLAAKTEITHERILQEYARLAFSDQRNYVRWGPKGVRMRPSAQLSDDEAAAVAEVSESVTQSGTSIKFKLHDKKGALDSLAKILGLMTERTINVDVATLSTEELERIANGEDPLSVLADTRAGGDRAA